MDRIALIADTNNTRARRAAADLANRYTFVAEPAADVGVVVGGDGFMLHTLHRLLDDQRALPLYGLNCGTVGFLLNRYEPDGLLERIRDAQPTSLHPIQLHAVNGHRQRTTRLAINEVSLFRASVQTARIRVTVDGSVQMDELHGDGLIIATGAGSTAYNRSAGGPVLPLTAQLLTVTPVAAFRPRSWRGALLPSDAEIHLDILDSDKRPVNAAADHHEVTNVRQVIVTHRPDRSMALLFDRTHTPWRAGSSLSSSAEQFR